MLWVDGAIHGDEPEGPLCCQILMREVEPEELSGTLVLVPVINVAAFEAASRGNPLDTFSHDMNRIYPGRPNGYLSERVAYAHSEWMTKVADMEISIHSGGAHSFLAPAMFMDERPESVELGTAMGPGWGCMMSSFNPKGSPMARWPRRARSASPSSSAGAPHTSPELFAKVGRGPRGRHPQRAAPLPACCRARRYTIRTAPRVRRRHCWRRPPASSWPSRSIEFLTPMKKGDLIARIVNMFGDELASLKAPADGMIFGLRALPNVTTGDWCCFFNKVEGPRV